jgi:hypothetical protein
LSQQQQPFAHVSMRAWGIVLGSECALTRSVSCRKAWEGLASWLMVGGKRCLRPSRATKHRCATAQARRVVTCASRVVQRGLLLAVERSQYWPESASLTCSMLKRESDPVQLPHSACVCLAVWFLQVLLLSSRQALDKHYSSEKELSRRAPFNPWSAAHAQLSIFCLSQQQQPFAHVSMCAWGIVLGSECALTRSVSCRKAVGLLGGVSFLAHGWWQSLSAAGACHQT